MKNILFILAFVSSACFGQGRKVAVFDPATNSYVYVYVFETLNPPTSTYISGTVPFTKLTGSDIIIPESQITNLTTDLGLKAPLASPTFTGTVTLPALAVTSGMLAGSIPYSKLTLTGAILNADLAGSIAYSKLNLTGAVLNADLAGSIAYSKLALTGAILNADLAGSIAYSKLSLTGAILNADLAGSIAESKVTNLVTDLAAKQGISAANTSATTGAMTVTMTSGTQTIFKITPTGACTFNASGGVAGARMTFIITTSGASSFVLTWGTNFRSTGTLATGTTTAKKFSVSFNCEDATTWVEESRTIAM